MLTILEKLDISLEELDFAFENPRGMNHLLDRMNVLSSNQSVVVDAQSPNQLIAFSKALSANKLKKQNF